MLRFYCFLTGTDHSLLVQDTPKSRQKVVLMGSVMLLPVITWAVCGYLLTHDVLEASIGAALFTSAICAFVVYLLERSIIMTDTTPGIKKFRIILGIAVAVASSMAIDEVIFKQDIDHQVEKNKIFYASRQADSSLKIFDSIFQVADKHLALVDRKQEIAASEGIAINEMNGIGTGKKGLGKVARQKLAMLREKKNEFAIQQAQYDSILSKRQQHYKNANDKALQEYNAGLMMRIGAMFQLIFNSWGMVIMYLVFTVIMFCLEFIVILIKTSMPETNYEKKLRLIEEIGDRRIKALTGPGSVLVGPAHFLPDAAKARVAINKKQAIF